MGARVLGVALGLLGPGAVRNAAAEMLQRVQAARPEARLEGFSIEPMVHRPGSYELILGVLADEQFGPVILCGHGGMAVEVIDDKALGLPPLNMHLAHEILSRTRIYRQLLGFRGQPGANIEAIALTLIKLAQMVIDIPKIGELDINPMLVDAYGVVALDARIKVAKTAKAAAERLAIRPYPKELEEEIVSNDGRRLVLETIR
ncbi:MAG: acetate--CoA ligase family protein [Gammaproteobacteria bacterium]